MTIWNSLILEKLPSNSSQEKWKAGLSEGDVKMVILQEGIL